MTILILTFYFEPDLGPGSFRNTSLVTELSHLLVPGDVIHVVTTLPNRYQSFRPKAPAHEEKVGVDGCRVIIDRIAVPNHANGLLDQVRSFWWYFRKTHGLVSGQQYDVVVASSSRLFTAFLGSKLARRNKTPLFLDIRDLFRETVPEVLRKPVLRLVLAPLLWAVEQYTFGYARHINLVSEGFRDYFRVFKQASYSYFTNGIDEICMPPITIEPEQTQQPDGIRTILYAGNIGHGQGLHTIIPQAAQRLGRGYRFIVIGNGGATTLLTDSIRTMAVQNVELRSSIDRRALIAEYQRADYLLVHLNNWKSLERVLPSKLIEYAATDKPILAGVAGYPARFIRQHIANGLIFNPGDSDDLVRLLRAVPYQTAYRPEFRAEFARKTISGNMARQILATVDPVAGSRAELQSALL